MEMELKGSCHCGAVKFSVKTKHPYPYQLCYCSICRKTGGSGYAINLSASHDTLQVEGRDSISVYQARMGPEPDAEVSPGQRHFCKVCASNLWLWDPRWPELMHPWAGIIDTPLPTPPKRTHLMLDYRPEWVASIVPIQPGDATFKEYPDDSIAQWHEKNVATPQD